MTAVSDMAFGVTTGSSDTEIVAQQGQSSVRVQALELIPLSSGACTVKVRTLSSGSTVGRWLVGSTGHGLRLSRNGVGGQGGVVLPFNYRGWAQGPAAHSVVLNNSTARAIQYNITYESVTTG